MEKVLILKSFSRAAPKTQADVCDMIVNWTPGTILL